MAATAIVCDSYVAEIVDGIHQASDVYKIALYTLMTGLTRATTVYSATNECAAGGDYAPGGLTLVGRVVGLSGTTTYIDWTTDPLWPVVSLSAAGALIYNATRANRACSVMDFGGTVTATGDAFIVALPAAGANATIHIANP